MERFATLRASDVVVQPAVLPTPVTSCVPRTPSVEALWHHAVVAHAVSRAGVTALAARQCRWWFAIAASVVRRLTLLEEGSAPLYANEHSKDPRGLFARLSSKATSSIRSTVTSTPASRHRNRAA